MKTFLVIFFDVLMLFYKLLFFHESLGCRKSQTDEVCVNALLQAFVFPRYKNTVHKYEYL